MGQHPQGLTVDYHEPGFASAVAGENGFTFSKGFWFQLSSRDRKSAKTPFGPLNPNRYSYVWQDAWRELISSTSTDGKLWLLHRHTEQFVIIASSSRTNPPRQSLPPAAPPTYLPQR